MALRNDNADIWTVATGGGEPVNITKGAMDGASFFFPVWSPDSERLAMLSTRGGGIRLWVWERPAHRLVQVMDREISSTNPPIWLSDREVACVVVPKGESDILSLRQAAEVPMREWPKAWQGKESTANVLDSGTPSDYKKRPKGALVYVDVIKYSDRVVAEGDFSSMTLSPDSRYVAMLEKVHVIARDPNTLVESPVSSTTQQLSVFSANGSRVETEKRDVNFIDNSIRWATNGTGLAVVGISGSASRVYVYMLGSGMPSGLHGEEVTERGEVGTIPTEFSRGLVWSARNELAVQVEPKASEHQSNRADWWLANSSGKVRNLTSSFKTVPAQLFAEAVGNSFIGLVDGKLWRIFADGSDPAEFTPGSDLNVTSVVWPAWQQAEYGTYGQMVVVSRKGMNANFYRVDLASGTFEALALPDPQCRMLSYDSNKRQGVFLARSGEGSYLWLTRPGLPIQTVAEANIFLKEIEKGEAKEFNYRSLDGQDLKAWLLLPPSYKVGKLYPTIAWVYAGAVHGGVPPFSTEINRVSWLNLQLLAARGFIVLLPSMPLKPRPEAIDPYMELTKGVLPALDRAIELGYADPNRLGLDGQSFGGYSTYGLVTQTNRFKAAISIAGPANLVSLYGTFDAMKRNGQFPHENLEMIWELESGYQMRMANPPWRDLGRYIRNSPISYVDRVETPLLIIYGDLDRIAMQQGEEFFTALNRQNKRAQFVRYWGEGHVLSSPANIRDMWYRTFAWFDEFLDVSRDAKGNILWNGDKLKSRNGEPPLKPEDFARFDQMIFRESQKGARNQEVAEPAVPATEKSLRRP